jgi:hypothetical protein
MHVLELDLTFWLSSNGALCMCFSVGLTHSFEIDHIRERLDLKFALFALSFVCCFEHRLILNVIRYPRLFVAGPLPCDVRFRISLHVLTSKFGLLEFELCHIVLFKLNGMQASLKVEMNVVVPRALDLRKVTQTKFLITVGMRG